MDTQEAYKIAWDRARRESAAEWDTRHAKTELHLAKQLQTINKSKARYFLSLAYDRILNGHADYNLLETARKRARELN